MAQYNLKFLPPVTDPTEVSDDHVMFGAAGQSSEAPAVYQVGAFKQFLLEGVSKASIGLGDVDNTSDANKPLSVAALAALSDTVQTPDSVPALRANLWPNGRPAIVKTVNNWVTGDGGLTYYWDVSSVANDNGGTIVKEASTEVGRWLPVFSGPVQVKWFGTDGAAYAAALAYATSFNLDLEGPTIVNGQEGWTVPSSDSLPDANPITLRWAALQLPGSGVTERLKPQIIVGGEGDEGVHTITMDGIKNGWDTIEGVVFGAAVAYDSAGAAVIISNAATSPPSVTFSTAGTANSLRHVWGNPGTILITRRALGVRASFSLIHGTILATDQQITIRAKINGVLAGNAIAREVAQSALESTTGDIILPAARAGDALTFEVTASNGSGSGLGIQIGSTVTIAPLALLPLERDLDTFGLHQGAALIDQDVAALSQLPEFYVSGLWTGNIASSNTVAHGQKFNDGLVSQKHQGIETRLNVGRGTRAISSDPSGPVYLAYMAATVAAPDGTLAGQAFFDRFASPAPGQTVFTATRDVFFVPTGPQYACSSWLQIVKVAGQYQIGYGLLYDLISPGVYRATTTVLGLTTTLTWSGVGARTLTIVISSPLVAGDYFSIAHATNRKIDVWTMTEAGRQNVREMASITFQGVKTKIDGIFLDLCNTSFLSKSVFWEVTRILRRFAPQGKMTFNALYPSAEAIEFIANCPYVLAGDTILIEGAGCSVGVDSSAATLSAVTERDRISTNGKHLRLAWLATIAQATAGPVETNAAVLTARDLYLANSKKGDKFGAHWSGLGTPFNGEVRPLPGRVSGITQWG